MRPSVVLVALALAALLQGCSREPVRTRVHPPRHSLPDTTVLRGPAVATPAAPAEAPPTSTLGAGAQRPPARTVPPPVTQGPLPLVRNPGDAQGAEWLAQRPLLVPVAGIAPRQLSDHFEQRRGQRRHEAIDILAPGGTPVVAVDDGRITKLFHSKPGGLTIYQYDPSGRLAYYYAHLERYAEGLREGQDVRRGQVIGYVGVSGNADPNAPHLHFAVFRLGTPPRWWEGEAVNPYPALSRAQPAPQVAAR